MHVHYDCSIRVYSIICCNFSYYVGIVLRAFSNPLYSVLCWHGWLAPNSCFISSGMQTWIVPSSFTYRDTIIAWCHTIIAIGHFLYTNALDICVILPSTDSSLLPNNLFCSSVNGFMLDNILQSLMQTTTPTAIDDAYYYTWLPAWTKIIDIPSLKVNLPLSTCNISTLLNVSSRMHHL